MVRCRPSSASRSTSRPASASVTLGATGGPGGDDPGGRGAGSPRAAGAGSTRGPTGARRWLRVPADGRAHGRPLVGRGVGRRASRVDGSGSWLRGQRRDPARREPPPRARPHRRADCELRVRIRAPMAVPGVTVVARRAHARPAAATRSSSRAHRRRRRSARGRDLHGDVRWHRCGRRIHDRDRGRRASTGAIRLDARRVTTAGAARTQPGSNTSARTRVPEIHRLVALTAVADAEGRTERDPMAGYNPRTAAATHRLRRAGASPPQDHQPARSLSRGAGVERSALAVRQRLAEAAGGRHGGCPVHLLHGLQVVASSVVPMLCARALCAADRPRSEAVEERRRRRCPSEDRRETWAVLDLGRGFFAFGAAGFEPFGGIAALPSHA